MSLCVTLVFFTISLQSKTSNEHTVAATAGYAAVVVVFDKACLGVRMPRVLGVTWLNS